VAGDAKLVVSLELFVGNANQANLQQSPRIAPRGGNLVKHPAGACT
jgi:hypothetical protein